MIDHVKLFVSDYGRSRELYLRALEPLGYSLIMESAEIGAGMGIDRPEFWLMPADGEVPTRAHIALRAETREAVDAFHAAALAAGAKDNGAPGLRPHYHEAYYGAFVHDFDGNNFEAVTHVPG